MTSVKFLPASAPKSSKPWVVQFRSHLWWFATQAQAQAFAARF